jgi:2-polyprenyl-3-methyl-5-hydroxy-6-metoxy-1,4-benzoquinol methylase
MLKINKESTKSYIRRLPGFFAYACSKPFFTDFPPDKIREFRKNALLYFNDFIHIANILSIFSPTTILDVGCGPGWLSEYLARLGYAVTGIDISPDFIEIAEYRRKSIPEYSKILVKYQCIDIHESDIQEQFDCAILYDSLHHLDDPDMVLRSIYALLSQNGFLIIKEGERPPKGSPEEKAIIDAMLHYQWLERPFFKDELRNMLYSAGFKTIEELFSLDASGGLQSQDRLEIAYRIIERKLFSKALTNYFIAFKTVQESTCFDIDPSKLKAVITPVSTPEMNGKAYQKKFLSFSFSLENRGEVAWANSPELLKGYVTFAARINDNNGKNIQDNRVTLQRIVEPGQSVDLELTVDISQLSPGNYTLTFDLVCEHVAWFAQYGTKPYAVHFCKS